MPLTRPWGRLGKKRIEALNTFLEIYSLPYIIEANLTAISSSKQLLARPRHYIEMPGDVLSLYSLLLESQCPFSHFILAEWVGNLLAQPKNRKGDNFLDCSMFYFFFSASHISDRQKNGDAHQHTHPSVSRGFPSIKAYNLEKV